MKKIAWLVPHPIKGSGGILNIFQSIQSLSDKYECHVYLENLDRYSPNVIPSVEEAHKIIESYYYEKINAVIHLGLEIDESDNYDLIISTIWYTAKIAADFNSQCKKAYFIQDYEAMFNPIGDTYIKAENSYRYGLIPITLGRWLSYKLQNEFGLKTYWYHLCADSAVYHKIEGIKKEKAICFIYQPEKPRRCSELGIESLQIVKELMPDVKIYLYGSSANIPVPFKHTNLDILSIDKCNLLYNKCTVGLCISSTNPSRIPFEMMASGLPVVDVYRENNLFDLPEGAVTLAEQTPEAIAYAILDILNNPKKQEQMSKNGRDYMKDKTNENILKHFTKIIDSILQEDEPEGFGPIKDKIYMLPPVVATDEFINSVKNSSETILKAQMKAIQAELHQMKAIQAELQRTQALVEAMRTSKFWKMRTQWFKVKKFLRISNEEEN